MPTNPDLIEVHSELLVLLKKFHEICIENDIKYSLHGGTLLGAVREKGFIPWDDDVDVTLTRQEYEKLCNVMKSKCWGDELEFEPETGLSSRLIMRREEKVAVWIDIFIYDYISEKRICQAIKIWMIMFFSSLIKTKETMAITTYKQERFDLKYILYYFGYLLGKLIPSKWKMHWRDWFCKTCFCGSKQYIHRSNDGFKPMHLILPVDVSKEYALVEFEDTKLMIASGAHEILVSSYGNDYMTPKKTREAELGVHAFARKNLNHEAKG